MQDSKDRDAERKGAQSQKNVMRAAQKNAKDALKAGDMNEWEKWNAVAGGKTFGARDSDQFNADAAAASARNTQDAANLRGGAPAPQNGAVPAVGNTPSGNNAMPKGASQDPNAAVGSPTSPSTVSSSNPYGLPSVDKENEARAVAEARGAFGTKSKAFKQFEDFNKAKNANNQSIMADRRSEANSLKEQYTSGAIDKEEFLGKGKALGGTDKSMGLITNKVDQANQVALDNYQSQSKISEKNAKILSEARNNGRLEERDLNYKPDEAGAKAKRLEQEAKDALANDEFKASQDKYAEDRTRFDTARESIDTYRNSIRDLSEGLDNKASRRADMDFDSDRVIAQGTGILAEEAQKRVDKGQSAYYDKEKERLTKMEDDWDKAANRGTTDPSTAGARQLTKGIEARAQYNRNLADRRKTVGGRIATMFSDLPPRREIKESPEQLQAKITSLNEASKRDKIRVEKFVTDNLWVGIDPVKSVDKAAKPLSYFK